MHTPSDGVVDSIVDALASASSGAKAPLSPLIGNEPLVPALGQQLVDDETVAAGVA